MKKKWIQRGPSPLQILSNRSSNSTSFATHSTLTDHFRPTDVMSVHTLQTLSVIDVGHRSCLLGHSKQERFSLFMRSFLEGAGKKSSETDSEAGQKSKKARHILCEDLFLCSFLPLATNNDNPCQGLSMLELYILDRTGNLPDCPGLKKLLRTSSGTKPWQQALQELDKKIYLFPTY